MLCEMACFANAAIRMLCECGRTCIQVRSPGAPDSTHRYRSAPARVPARAPWPMHAAKGPQLHLPEWVWERKRCSLSSPANPPHPPLSPSPSHPPFSGRVNVGRRFTRCCSWRQYPVHLAPRPPVRSRSGCSLCIHLEIISIKAVEGTENRQCEAN